MSHSSSVQSQFRSLLPTITKNRKKLVAALGFLVLAIVVFRVSVITVRSHSSPVGPVSGPTVAAADESARDVAIFNKLFPTLAMREADNQGMYRLLHHRWATPLLAPVVTASKTDALFTDVDGDNNADPGDTLKYTVTINASGEDATGVTFTDTVDPNTAFVGGSLTATPVAVNDSYSALGNVRIQVPAGSGVLVNDFLGLPNATIAGAPVTTTSTNGGNVTLNADGSFTYNPPPGFEGSDTFTYTLTNSEGSNNATVTITVSGMIWFINNNTTCPCDGRLTNPFDSLSAFNAVNNGAGNNPAANDNIFVYESSTDYVGPVTLLNGQRFIGQDASATLSSLTGLTPPAHSDPLPATNNANSTIVNITSATTAITVGSGNTLVGFTGGNSGTDIDGTNFGTLTVFDVTLNGTGQALNLTTGTLAAAFDGISSTNSATTGISLTSVSGSLTSDATTITNPTGIGISVSTSGANLDLANTAVNGSGGTGISLSGNGGNFIFGDLDIAPDANQRAFHATSNTGTFSSTSGTISASGATAVEIVGPSTASRTLLNMTLTSVSASGGVNGILLQNTTTNPGGFTVTGSSSGLCGGSITPSGTPGVPPVVVPGVALDCTGGTIQGTTSDAIKLTDVVGVSFTRMLIQNIGTGVADNAKGIEAVNLGGSNFFKNGQITGLGNVGGFGGADRNGIDIRNNNTNLTLFSIEDSYFSNSDSGTSFVLNFPTGSSNTRLDVIDSIFEDLEAIAVQSSAGNTEGATQTAVTNITGSVFRNAGPNGQGGTIVSVNEQGCSQTFNVANNTYFGLNNGIASGLNAGIVQFQTTGGVLAGTVDNNIVGTTVDDNGDRRGIEVVAEPDVSVNGELGSFDVIIKNNFVDRTTNREAIFVDVREDTQDSELVIQNNSIGNLAGFEGQVGGIREAVDVQARGETAKTLNLLMSGNNIRATSSVFMVNLELNIDAVVTPNISFQATVTGNTLRNTGTGSELMARTRAGDTTGSLCLDMTGNTLDSGAGTIELDRSGTNALNVEQASQAALALANGIPTANVIITGTPTFGVTCAAPPMARLLTWPIRDYFAMARGGVKAVPQASKAQSSRAINTVARRGIVSRKADKLHHASIRRTESSAANVITKSTEELTAKRLNDAVKALNHAGALNSAMLADVNLAIGTLPAGESVTITFRVTVDDPFTGAMAQVCNQGTVSGTNFSAVLTDDPDVGGSADATCTPIDLPAVSVAVSPASVAEDGATNLVYTFTRNGSTAAALTVNFSIGGTATFGASPNDYTQTGAATFSPPNGTVTIGAGNTTAMVTVDPEADTTVESDETVVLTVTSGTGYVVGAPSSAIGTITNDDTDVSVAVAPLSVAEDGATNLVYTFTRTGVTTGSLTVNFSIGGTATFGASPNDYTQTGATTFTPPAGTVTFSAGSSTAQVTVDPEADTTVEPDETVILTVTAGTGYNVGSPSSATGTITNDDADVSIAVSPASVTEDGATNLVYTFTRTGFTSGALTVNFTIGGTATFGPSPDDYTQTGATTFTPPTGTVTFGAGNSTAQITVDPEADAIAEPDETVILTLATGTGYNVVSPNSATGTILNDDTVVTVAVSPASQPEGGGNLVYTFTRTGSTASSLTVNFSVGGTASFPADYSQSGAATFTPPTATVTIGAGNSSASVNVTPLTDCLNEGNETVEFTVQPGTGYGVGSPSTATGTIVDVPDATAPVITLDPNRPMSMWPPDHSYNSFTVSQFVQSASDNCDPNVDASDVYITKITSDEAEGGAGDGTTLNDITIAADCKSFQLRAERSLAGNGRVYTIHFKVVDSNGNVGTATATVFVPLSINGTAVDSGPVYTVMSVCP